MSRPLTTPDQTPVRRLLNRHLAHKRPYEVRIDGLTLTMLPRVFCPTYTKTSSFLAEHVQIEPGDHVLDVFSGSGYQGLLAAGRAATVTCVDWSDDAVRCARINVESNGMADRVTVRKGDLFGPVTGRYDVVIANPPLLPGVPEDLLGTAVFDPGLGHSKKFIEEVGGHLTDTGRAYLLATDAHKGSGIFDVLDHAASHGLTARPIAHRRLPYETYTVYELHRAAPR